MLLAIHLTLIQMKKALILLTSLFLFNTTFAQTARVQVIHNCADLAADSVDVYLKTVKILDNFAFRTATPFITVPAGVPEIIGIAPKGSTSVADTIYSLTVTLTPNEKYILVANGIVSTSGYMPGATMVPFRVSVFPMAHEVADTTGRTDVLVLHGSTDAPMVDVRAASSLLVNDISFGEFSTGYLSLPTANYSLVITNSTGTVIVQSYSAPLSTLGLTDSAITVLASGFLDSTVNSNGRAFGLWVTKASGGGLIPLPLASVTALSSELNPLETILYPNPTSHTLNLSVNQGELNRIEIWDINGKLIQSFEEVLNASIDIHSLPQGMYLIKLQDTEGNWSVERFRKE